MSERSRIHMPEDHMEELYSSDNPLVRFVHGSRLDQVVGAMPRGSDFRVLDAGCGEGHLIEKLHACNSTHACVGADLTPVALEKARQRCPFAEFHEENLLHMSFDDASFDVVVCTEVLEHIAGYEAVVAELERVLKPGGHLILTFPNEVLWTAARFLLGRQPVKVPDHVNVLSPRQIDRLTDMKLVSVRNLPFGLPFFVSLGCLMKLRKRLGGAGASAVHGGGRRRLGPDR